jgi:hypothetical protein
VSETLPDLTLSNNIMGLHPIDYGEENSLTPILGYASFTIDYEAMQWFRHGHRFCRSDWGIYRPLPKFLRIQGRMAKDQFSTFNDHPEIRLQTQRGETLILDACPCGGSLMLDQNTCMYCETCGEIYNDQVL